MGKTQLDRANIERITRFVAANGSRIGDAIKPLMRDDDGNPLPFVLLLPTGDGTHTIANLETATVAAMLRALATRMERDQLAKMFAEAMEVATALVEAGAIEPVEDNGDKVH